MNKPPFNKGQNQKAGLLGAMCKDSSDQYLRMQNMPANAANLGKRVPDVFWIFVIHAS